MVSTDALEVDSVTDQAFVSSVAPAAPLARRRTAKAMPWKRVVDLVLASGALLVLAPLLLLLAILVVVDSRGPALYGQRRIGRLGVPFTLWKFRSMHEGSSQEIHEQAALDWFRGCLNGERYKSERDPRITRLGKHLRRTSLDEMPQLFNVLRGEMSLVGPRPLTAHERMQYEAPDFERELVAPGITGLWQVSGRDRLSARQMMELDLAYVRGCSFGLDLKILARTIPAVVADARRA
jgi:lipopolysaccharide/colanic/teichoic acid biosynthesis glycosyltransferase